MATEVPYITQYAIWLEPKFIFWQRIPLIGKISHKTKRANESIYNINIILTSVQRSFDNSGFNILRTFPFLNIEGNHPEKSFCQKVDDLDAADD